MCTPCAPAELIQPDDWHHHLRDGAALATTVPAAARQFQRAIIMPNLVPPVTTTEMAQEYKKRILDALHASGAPAGSFDPMMTMYLTDTTPPEEVKRAAESGDVKAFKLYPAGATTNSASGVTDLANVTATLQAMALHGMPLCVHGEVTDADIDVFDRERVFFKTKAAALLSNPTPDPDPNPILTLS
jgi:dihydroorotase